ncbi:hypothetical protein EDC04DRAFT_3088768, partial [Pisolithus marmoratus]
MCDVGGCPWDAWKAGFLHTSVQPTSLAALAVDNSTPVVRRGAASTQTPSRLAKGGSYGRLLTLPEVGNASQEPRTLPSRTSVAAVLREKRSSQTVEIRNDRKSHDDSQDLGPIGLCGQVIPDTIGSQKKTFTDAEQEKLTGCRSNLTDYLETVRHIAHARPEVPDKFELVASLWVVWVSLALHHLPVTRNYTESFLPLFAVSDSSSQQQIAMPVLPIPPQQCMVEMRPRFWLLDAKGVKYGYIMDQAFVVDVVCTDKGGRYAHRLVEACQTPARTFRMEAKGLRKQAGEVWHSKSWALRTLATVDDDDRDSLHLIFRTTSLGKVVMVVPYSYERLRKVTLAVQRQNESGLTR